VPLIKRGLSELRQQDTANASSLQQEADCVAEILTSPIAGEDANAVSFKSKTA